MAINPFTGGSMALADVPVELQPQFQQSNRQQQMANLLLQQGMSGQPQGQMVSGHYVKPSWAQQLAPMANQALAMYAGYQADKGQTELAAALRGKQEKDITQFGELLKTDPSAAYAFASKSYVPQLREAGLKKMMPQEFDLAEGANRYQTLPDGTTRVIASGTPKPRAPLQVDTGTHIEFRDPLDPTKLLQRIPKGISPDAAARFADEGIAGYGGGGGQPMVRTGAPAGQAAFTPSTLPTYQADPMLSPKQNRELAMEFSKKQGSNITNAKDSFDLMKEAGKILSTGEPSSGALSNLLTYAGEAVNLPYGARKKESEADASLKMLSGALTMKQPRFEGPQGVLDVTLYQKLAGDLGNANIPVESRLATMKQMVTLQKKYYPNGDWDSIDTKLKDAGKVSLGASKQPSSAPTYAVNPQTGERIMSTDNGKNWKPAGGK
jgi:hypothetical protein